MKTIPIIAHYQGNATTLAHGLRIERTDGQVFGFTSHSRSETIGGLLYEASQGLDVSQIVLTVGTSVDNLELTTLDDGTIFSTLDVLSGVWRNASFLIIKYNWKSPASGSEPLIGGTIGEVFMRENVIVGELRGLQQYFQQPVGNVSTKLCRARFADYPTPSSTTTLCRMSPVYFFSNGTVTAVASNRAFTDTGMGQAADYFTEGVLEWTTGNNAGLRQKVKAFASGGVFTLSLSMLAAIQVGDQFTVLAGCTKRIDEDCRDKFNNELNFQGEPHRPLVDRLTETAEPSA